MKIIVTNHARQRMKERLELDSDFEIEKSARKAFYKGFGYREVGRQLQKYMWKRYVQHNYKGDIKLYKNHLYVFKYNVLVTVIDIPSFIKSTEPKRNPCILEMKKC